MKYNLKDKYIGLDILGPAPCFLEKLKSNYRYQLVFKSKKVMTLMVVLFMRLLEEILKFTKIKNH